MIENVDRRALAGFRCIDAVTSSSILAPLAVSGTPLGLFRNRSGIYAVMDAPNISRNRTQILLPDPNSWPAPTAYEITIQDPSLQYLPRKANIQVPQPLPAPVTRGTSPPTTTTTPPVTTTPAPTTTAQSAASQLPPVSTPQTVVMYPSPAAPISPNWAIVRVSVTNSATPPQPLPGAVVQISGATTSPLTGVTNSLGEALLAVPGLGWKVSSNSGGAVSEVTTAATISAWCDPTLLSKPAGWISNPDDILNNLSSSNWKSAPPTAVQLAPGQTVFVTLTISM